MRARIAVGVVTALAGLLASLGNAPMAWAFAACTPNAAAPSGHWPDSRNSALFGTQRWEFDWRVAGDGLEVANVKYAADLGQPRKMVIRRAGIPFLPSHYPENALTCAGVAHGTSNKLTSENLDPKPFCCAHVATTLCHVPDRPAMCSPLTDQIATCASGTTSCNGVCTGTQIDGAAPLEDGVGEVVSGSSDADIVLTAQFLVGGNVMVQRWRFQDNGTIIPTMRIGGLESCQLHNHQIYFRFNFEMGALGPVSEALEQCGSGGCPDLGSGGWTALPSSCGNRPTASARWRMTDSSAPGRAVIIQTGSGEGSPATFCEGTTSECGAAGCVNGRDFCALPAAEPTETFVPNACNDHLSDSVAGGATDLAFWYLSHVDHHNPCTSLPMCDPAIGTVAFGPTIRLVGDWGPQWTPVVPLGAAPPPRWQHNAIYDAGSNRMLLYGGKIPTSDYATDVWVLANANGAGAGGSTWLQLFPSGVTPAGRHMSSLVYDAANKRATIFGGHVATGGFSNDVWVLDHADGSTGTPQWTQITPVGTPPSQREWHRAVYVPATNRMVIFGGTQGLSDVWVLDRANGLGGVSTWTQLGPAGTPPPARRGHAAFYAPGSNRMVIFGGGDNGFVPPFFNDVWVLDNPDGTTGTPTWSSLNVTGVLPEPREDFGAAYDPGTNRMLMFGGWIGSSTSESLFDDAWVLNHADGTGGTPFWTRLSPQGPVPSAREWPTAILDPSQDRAVIFGGRIGPSSMSTLLNDVIRLDHATAP